MKTVKRLCDIKKKDREKFKNFVQAVSHHPVFTCKKCERRSNDASVLCKPQKIT